MAHVASLITELQSLTALIAQRETIRGGPGVGGVSPDAVTANMISGFNAKIARVANFDSSDALALYTELGRGSLRPEMRCLIIDAIDKRVAGSDFRLLCTSDVCYEAIRAGRFTCLRHT